MKNLISFFCVFMYYMSSYRLAGHQMPEFVGLLAVVLAIIKKNSLKHVARKWDAYNFTNENGYYRSMYIGCNDYYLFL